MIRLEEALSNRVLGRYEIEDLSGRKFVRADSLVVGAIRDDYWELTFGHGRFGVHRIALAQPTGGRYLHIHNLDLWLPVTTERMSYDSRYRW